MKKVLVINYFFPPLGGGGVFRTVKFIKYLQDFGWQSVILTVQNPVHWAQDPSLLEELSDNLKIYKTLTLEPFYLHVFFSKLGLGKLFDDIIERIWPIDQKIGWCPHSIVKGIDIVKKEDIDIIYTTSPPHSCHLIGLALKKWTRRPWVADFRDPWTQAVILRSKSNLQKKIDEYAEQKVVNRCDLVVTSTEGIRSKLIEKYKITNQKVVTITNGYDEADFSGINHILSENERFTITYTGSFYQDYSPLPFIRGLKRFLRMRPGVKNRMRVYFIGKMDEYKDMIRDELKNVAEVKGYLPHRDAIRYMVNSHLLLLILPSKPGAEVLYSGKIFEYMASGVPILALVPNGLPKQLIEESGTGFTVDPGDIEAIAETIDKLYKDWEMGKLGINPAKEIIKKYERKALTQTLAAEFNKLLG